MNTVRAIGYPVGRSGSTVAGECSRLETIPRLSLSPEGGHGKPSTLPVSGQDPPDDLSMDIGEAEVTPLVLEGQFFVINSQEVQDRRVEIMNVHRV